MRLIYIHDKIDLVSPACGLRETPIKIRSAILGPRSWLPSLSSIESLLLL